MSLALLLLDYIAMRYVGLRVQQSDFDLGVVTESFLPAD